MVNNWIGLFHNTISDIVNLNFSEGFILNKVAIPRQNFGKMKKWEKLRKFRKFNWI